MNGLPINAAAESDPAGPPFGGVHRLVEIQAAQTPDAWAIAPGGAGRVGLTYRALDSEADALAETLGSHGVTTDSPVGLCHGRSPEAIVAVLAVLKAGGCYVPLAPEYPAERLAYMLENAGARLLLADASLWKTPLPPGITLLPARNSADFSSSSLALDPQSSLLSPSSSAAAPHSALRTPSSALAYIIYTSGSTGRPKGVSMPHSALLNLLHWHARAHPLAPGTRVLQFAPLSFDVSFQEIFSTLAAGGTLHLIPDEQRIDPRGLLRLMTEARIERVFLPPVMLYQLAEQSAHCDHLPTSLREVIVAGEALRITPAVSRLFSALPGCGLHNHYGPTETHVATAWTLPGTPGEWPALPPIGRPIAGVVALLLDEANQPVPDGQPGALWLGGACVALGYVHDPERTAARFVERDGTRFYQTGDLVRRSADGVLEFLGRGDDQVKIRGFRVELGEVEAALSRHPAVQETAVAAHSDPTLGTELVGYVVPRAGESVPSSTELRRWLLETLPDYLVPTHFATLATLPLTPSGKVDRRALPRPAAAPAGSTSATGAPPGSALEKVIARLWAETLAIDPPGVRDNFFEVGGTSLAAVKIHSRLVQALQREFPVIALFEHPTIAALASFLEPNSAKSSVPTNPSLSNTIRDRANRQQQAAAAAAADHARLVPR